jgi:hypothetical protein
MTTQDFSEWHLRLWRRYGIQWPFEIDVNEEEDTSDDETPSD